MLRIPGSSTVLLACLALVAALTLDGCAPSTTQTKAMTPQEKAGLYVDAANAAWEDSDTVSALEYLNRAEQIDPDMPEVYHMRALVFASRKDYPTAIRAAHKAIQLKPGYSAANDTLGKLYMDSGHPDEAVPYLTAAATDPLNREAFKAYTNLGILYYRKGDYAKAQKYLDSAVFSDPDAACIAYYYRGHLHLKKAEFDQAIQDYSRATGRFCASFAEAYLALGIAYERSGRYQLARKKFLEIRDHFATSAVADQAMKQLQYLP